MIERMRFSGEWRAYQARALAEMERHLGDHRLHIVAAPGAGKTVLGLEIVRRLGKPALVFAPSLAIRDQWRERLVPLFMDQMPTDADISRKLSDPRALTLSTYQSLDGFRRSDDLSGLITRLNARGPFTLVLDEAHHLRRAWWECLDRLGNELTDVTIVALTATPPYDASLTEWNRYEALCGPIDLEIGIPELVRNGDLCPHQDHLVLSRPTEDALALLDRRRKAISDLHIDLIGDSKLLDGLGSHLWLTDPDRHIEQILDAPEMLSAVLILLGSAGRELPQAPLDLLGVSAKSLPQPSLFWLERLLDGLLFQHKHIFPLDPDRSERLHKRLHRHGLIEGRRVRLRHTRSVFRLLASSLAKLDSIGAIAAAERRNLGDALRMVVLSDHIRAGELPRSPDDAFKPAKLGVVPIFESLRRSGAAGSRIGVLTGSLVVIPRSAVESLAGIANDFGMPRGSLRCKDMKACPDHVELQSIGGNSADQIRLVTVLFQRGDVQVLVGTQSLLGQGWDAPALNSLVLASNTASFMLSNQMRGRAIRIDPARPDKVANIWHMATIEPDESDLMQAIETSLDWGGFNDNGPGGLSDIGVVARRFRAFECISNGDSRLIESGLGRLNLDPSRSIGATNRHTFGIAADRAALAAKWSASLGDGEERSRVRETAAPNYAPRGLSWFDTLHAAAWSAGGTAAIAGANELRAIASFEALGLAAMAIAGVATLASLPRLAKAGWLAWRNGSLEGSLSEVTHAILEALAKAEIIGSSEAEAALVDVRTSVDGRNDVVVANVSRATERHVMQAIAEALGPVQNPRYLLVRKSWLGPKRRTDYHAVPSVLGARKEFAEAFHACWQAQVGSSRLVFTRNREGRQMLLRARMRSLAAGFQRSVDRRSAWL